MAPNSPESPSKKRKQPINGLKRDRPLFAGRRPQRALQQPPEFFTDSLNTSYIPSPSPPKSPTRKDVRAKPRQTFGNGRSLASAFEATPRVNDENRPPSSSSSSDRRRTQGTLKPPPAQTGVGAKDPTPNKTARSPARTRTPTPPRGRQVSLTSPSNSESSPGRGYAEAYQRIIEEENLAHEDSIEDMEGIEEYDGGQQDASLKMSRSRSRRLQHSASPMSLKASRRASPRGTMQQNTPEIDHEEITGHQSDSESGIDLTENITDTSVGSGSSQYAKDLQRLGALKNGAKAFSKARMGDKVGLTVENLQRRNGSNESLGSAFSAGSFSNRGSDPSINVPKAWGRKAKPGKDWLARINSKSGRFTGDVPKRQSSGDQMIAENQRREWSEPIDQWIASAAEVPLPSSEDRSSQTRDSSQGSTPTTAIPRPMSLDRRRQWSLNEDDFTGGSMQISESPPIRIRNAALDRIREREMENLEKRAVTSSRLGELREKSSMESLRRTKSNKSIEDPQPEQSAGQEAQGNERSPSPSKLFSEVQGGKQDATPEDSMQDEGEPVPDTPVVIYRSNSHDQANPAQRDGKGSEGSRQPDRRPSHERKDSHDLLKRLARVTSESPSPRRGHAELVRRSTEPGVDTIIDQTPHTSKSTTDLQTPVVTGAWVDQTNGDTPQASVSNANLKTPLVTGAWIDTPLPTGGRGPPMPTPSDQEERKELHAGKVGAADLIHRLSPNTITPRPKLQSQVPLKYSGPPLSKSALEEILKDARSIKTDIPPQRTRDPNSAEEEEDPILHLGDSTIQSLEDLIATDEDFSTLLAPTPPSPQSQTETTNPSSDPSPASQAPTTTSTATTRSSRLADLQSYTHLLSRLTTLAPSLRASKKRIETLERAVATVPSSNNENRTRALANANQTPNPCNEGGSLHDFLFPCPHCSCPGPAALPPEIDLPSLLALHASLTTLTIPIPRLWTWPRTSYRPRLTWLGVAVFTAYGLYLCESYARFRFCHPLYAREMVGYGVDIDAPRPPFVAVKVLWRYATGGRVVGGLFQVVRVLARVLADVVGWVVGFVFGGGGSDGVGNGEGGRERVPASRDQRIPRPAWGPDLSLMDDEYL